jgi:hypothetical protein
VTDPSRRWEGDDRGVGVGDGRAFRPGIDLLAGTLDDPGWVAEDAEIHLLPHINRACERSGRLRVVDAQTDGSVYAVTLEWIPERPTKPGLREDVFALIGSFAEQSTHVRQRVLDDTVEFDVTTGMLPGDASFRPHGHLVRLRVVGGAVRRIPG